MIPEAVVQAFESLAAAETLSCRVLSSGLLHQTLELRADDETFILQRVSEVFAPEIHQNIDRVTRHLAERGLTTFRLCPTRDGALYSEPGEVGRWRLLTAIEGHSFDRVQSVQQARSAGALVGRFHAALDDFEAPLAPLGIPFRDTPLYLERLAAAIRAHSGHPMIGEVVALADTIRAGFERLGPPPVLPLRVIHGDLKISNLLFESADPPGRDRAVALIDLDTLMRAPLWSEWGDAWRSWCNQKGEDEREASFDLGIFEASLEGFAAGYEGTVSAAERMSLLLATERLSLELATRYATDVLEESYFAWDRERFSASAEHNRVRAEGQLALFEAAFSERSRRRVLLDAL